MITADLEAEVIKLEDLDRPDEARAVGPYFQGDQSLYFNALNTGKLSLAMRLGHASTADVLRDLIRSVDVVIDNYRPGVMRRFGLDHDTAVAINPLVLTCSITGFGGGVHGPSCRPTSTRSRP
jgi:formyl-CoA transferase